VKFVKIQSIDPIYLFIYLVTVHVHLHEKMKAVFYVNSSQEFLNDVYSVRFKKCVIMLHKTSHKSGLFHALHNTCYRMH
jgi:hypothetical protein